MKKMQSDSLFASLIASLIMAVAPSCFAQMPTLEISTLVNEYRNEHEQEILADFVNLLSMPNDSANSEDIDANAELISQMLQLSLIHI